MIKKRSDHGEKENEREVAIWRKREISSNSGVVHC